MKPLRILTSLISVILVSASLSGCGGSWLEGKWIFDQEQTIEAMTPPDKAPAGEDPGFLKNVFSGLQKGVSQLLLTQLQDMEVEFTSTELRRTQNGSGEAHEYEVIEKPNADTLVIKLDDGEINTLERMTSGFRMLMPGEGKMWIYFKPAE